MAGWIMLCSLKMIQTADQSSKIINCRLCFCKLSHPSVEYTTNVSSYWWANTGPSRESKNFCVDDWKLRCFWLIHLEIKTFSYKVASFLDWTEIGELKCVHSKRSVLGTQSFWIWIWMISYGPLDLSPGWRPSPKSLCPCVSVCFLLPPSIRHSLYLSCPSVFLCLLSVSLTLTHTIEFPRHPLTSSCPPR